VAPCHLLNNRIELVQGAGLLPKGVGCPPKPKSDKPKTVIKIGSLARGIVKPAPRFASAVPATAENHFLRTFFEIPSDPAIYSKPVSPPRSKRILRNLIAVSSSPCCSGLRLASCCLR